MSALPLHMTCHITVSMILILCRPTLSPNRPNYVAQTSFAQTIVAQQSVAQ